MYQKFETLKHCPYCQNGNLPKLFSAPDRLTNKPGTYFLSKCTKCELVFQNPRIIEKYIGEFYPPELTYYQPKIKNSPRSVFQKIKKWFFYQILINHFNYGHLGKKYPLLPLLTCFFKNSQKINLIPFYVTGGKVLEIGSSHGGKLELLRNYGWEVEGIEMDKNSANYAKSKRNIKVQNIALEDAKFPNNSFDVIILSMVLEHLYDPFGKLIKISEWLKPGGQLLISIPYFNGLEFRIFKSYAYGLQLPTHITFFNKKILKNFLKNNNFCRVNFYFQRITKDFTASADYKYRETGGKIYKFIAKNKLFHDFFLSPLLRILSYLQMTSRISIHAIKNN